MRISVVMPVSLTPYTNSATNLSYKFMRAVQSFIDQEFKDAELIIISDGSQEAENVYDLYFNQVTNIRFKKIDKQILFSGMVRQSGIEIAKGEIISYLDADDMLGKDHLKIINDNFTSDWVYYNDYLIKGKEGDSLVFTERKVAPQLYYIGTSMIAHRRDLNVVWGDGYCHDWRMIERYLIPRKGIKIPTPQYYVCHFHPIDL